MTHEQKTLETVLFATVGSVVLIILSFLVFSCSRSGYISLPWDSKSKITRIVEVHVKRYTSTYNEAPGNCYTSEMDEISFCASYFSGYLIKTKRGEVQTSLNSADKNTLYKLSKLVDADIESRGLEAALNDLVHEPETAIKNTEPTYGGAGSNGEY